MRIGSFSIQESHKNMEIKSDLLYSRLEEGDKVSVRTLSVGEGSAQLKTSDGVILRAKLEGGVVMKPGDEAALIVTGKSDGVLYMSLESSKMPQNSTGAGQTATASAYADPETAAMAGELTAQGYPVNEGSLQALKQVITANPGIGLREAVFISGNGLGAEPGVLAAASELLSADTNLGQLLDQLAVILESLTPESAGGTEQMGGSLSDLAESTGLPLMSETAEQTQTGAAPQTEPQTWSGWLRSLVAAENTQQTQASDANAQILQMADENAQGVQAANETIQSAQTGETQSATTQSVIPQTSDAQAVQPQISVQQSTQQAAQPETIGLQTVPPEAVGSQSPLPLISAAQTSAQQITDLPGGTVENDTAAVLNEQTNAPNSAAAQADLPQTTAPGDQTATAPNVLSEALGADAARVNAQVDGTDVRIDAGEQAVTADAQVENGNLPGTKDTAVRGENPTHVNDGIPRSDRKEPQSAQLNTVFRNRKLDSADTRAAVKPAAAQSHTDPQAALQDAFESLETGSQRAVFSLLRQMPAFKDVSNRNLSDLTQVLFRTAGDINADKSDSGSKQISEMIDKIFAKLDGSDAAAQLKKAQNELLVRLSYLEDAISESSLPGKERLSEQTQKLMNQVKLTDSIDRFVYIQLPVMIGNERKNADLYIYKQRKGTGKIDPDNVKILLALDLSSMGHLESFISIRGKEVTVNMETEGEQTAAFFKQNTTKLHKLLAEAGFKLSDTRIYPRKEDSPPVTAATAAVRLTEGFSGGHGIDFTI